MSRRRLGKPGLPGPERGPKRDLVKVRAESVRMAAVAGGWRRESVTLSGPGGAPEIKWVGPGGMVYKSDDPEVMPEPLRQAVRAQLIGLFSCSCRICGARAQWLTEEQAARADLGRVWLMRFERVEAGKRFTAPEHVFALEHAADCPVRPAHIERMMQAGSN